MTAGYESKLDTAERDNLLKMISDMEIARIGATSGSRWVFEPFLVGMRARLAGLERKITDNERKEADQAREQIVLVEMAGREVALSAQERETFSGLLKKAYFTKADFGSLESFYAKTWDRLSDKGKDALSERVWEGVRRNDYTFAELPEVVRKKESDLLYLKLTDGKHRDPKTEKIPPQDRADFVREYESGNRKAAEEVLNRKSFAENLGSPKVASVDATSKEKKAEETKQVEAQAKGIGNANAAGGQFRSEFVEVDGPTAPPVTSVAAAKPALSK